MMDESHKHAGAAQLLWRGSKLLLEQMPAYRLIQGRFRVAYHVSPASAWVSARRIPRSRPACSSSTSSVSTPTYIRCFAIDVALILFSASILAVHDISANFSEPTAPDCHGTASHVAFAWSPLVPCDIVTGPGQSMDCRLMILVRR